MTTPAKDKTRNGRSRVLATDLDGTLIPLPDQPEHVEALQSLAHATSQGQWQLVFSTGRHVASVLDAIEEHRLPDPAWMICDVGTTILRQKENGWQPLPEYRQYLSQRCGTMPLDQLRDRLTPVEGLELQEEVKQGEFKLSFYAPAEYLALYEQAISGLLQACDAPYSIVASVDPFNGDGLIDLLPLGATKASALAWWAEFVGLPQQAILFAGDSGNDLAALTAGYRAVLVGNADRAIAEAAQAAHRQQGWDQRLYLAENSATAGVLEGCRWFGWLD